MKIKRILHASDFSKASRPAFRLACELARTLKAELVVFNAAQVVLPMLGEGYVSPAVVDQVWTAGRREAERGVDRLVRAARAQRVRVRGAVDEGPAATEILKAARLSRRPARRGHARPIGRPSAAARLGGRAGRAHRLLPRTLGRG